MSGRSVCLAFLLLSCLGLALVGCPLVKADFAGDPPVGAAPLTVTFTDASTGPVQSWEWDLNGDGTVDSRAKNPSYSYPAAGAYTVTLTVRGALFGKATEKKDAYVTVNAPGEGTHRVGDVATFAGIEFVWVPAGAFAMGSAQSAEELENTYGDRIEYFKPEHPQHVVTLTHGFWIGKYEVTQAQWSAVMGSNPSDFNDNPNRPVEQVTWANTTDDTGGVILGVEEFLNRLNARGEGTFRLPTEAEWEYACRAGSTSDFCYGNDVSTFSDYAWTAKSESTLYTIAVGQKKPNAWGLYDMHGNVLEWCQDWYSADYYGSSPAQDPTGPAEGRYRVRRGGGWRSSPGLCRSAFRTWNAPTFTINDTGLRLCRQP